jgi:hypothetical protein
LEGKDDKTMNDDQLKAQEKRIPADRINDFSGGTHWPESGNFTKWLSERISGLEKNLIIFSHELCSTNTGGVRLIVRGILREEMRQLLAGTACPMCALSYKTPDNIAIHLVDVHRWDDVEARLWLRDKIEECAFYEEA